ncbi:MAG: ABC transporter permease [Oscillospiraceae bacterium]|nr:ABC transporter permease [Oscillospiraceae bacterium]
MANTQNETWTTVIRPKTGWFDIDLKELWQYRDLVWMFVKRNFTVLYKQTILGPAWILLNPLLTTVMFNLVFGGIAGIPTDGVPSFLFYMAGNTVWTLFSSCINNTANTFVTNAAVMGKVYFPRLTVPISQVFTSLINFGIQLAMFLCFWAFYAITQPGSVHMTAWMLFMPVVLLEVLMLGLGVGIIVSSLTTKYRDLAIAVTFGVQLWMYATPVVYPMSSLATSPRMAFLVNLNPVTHLVEVSRLALLGTGTVTLWGQVYTAVCTLVLLAVGVVLFSRIEKTFMDTV